MTDTLDPSSFLISALSVIIGFVFIYSSYKLVKNTENDILKSYFKWQVAGSVLFTGGFIGDLAKYVFGNSIAEPLHHIFLIIALVTFAVSGFILAQEFKRQKEEK